MAGSRKVLIIAVLVAVWCVAMVRRCGATDRAASPAAAALPVTRAAAAPAPVAAAAPVAPTPVAPTAAAAPDAGIDAAAAAPTPVAADPADAADAADPVRDRVWAAKLMVSSDGKQIFHPWSSSDGARGSPNLTFDILDRAGKRVRHLAVLDVDQPTGDDSRAPEVLAKVKAQERAAAAMLDELVHAGWATPALIEVTAAELTDAEVEAAHGAATFRHHAELVVDGKRQLTIDLTPAGTLTVKPAGHAAITRHDASWRSKPTAAQQREIQKQWDAGNNGCYNAAYLGGATVDLTHRFALVEIPYHGSDSCWEGDPSRVLITW